ncbi:protein kinase [Streptomyces sp. NPDC018610]|uniref:serine/threonine-protein kinase n=1 Tax=Streptomyces sp. NPDC018610 TaxID=3365049 RepID=UPI0037ACBB83
MGEVFAGRYELADPIGRGGVGAVWRAFDHRRRRYVAAKVLQQRDAHSLLRFVREQALRIDHPHVLAPASWAADDDKVLFTMDLVAGGSLVHLVGDYGPLPPAFVCTLLDQLLSGLAAVHAEGVVHRDIKPANVLLEATGTGRPRLRLSDFGIAMRLGEPRLTEADLVVGTPGYLAPEQMMGAEPDFPADLFATGLVALYLLQGAKPDTRALVEHFAEHGTPSAAKGVPDPLWQVVATLLQPDPDARFRTATGARKALAAAVELLPDPGPDDELIEIFDQLGPLPPGFALGGPLERSPGVTVGAAGAAVPGPAQGHDHETASDETSGPGKASGTGGADAGRVHAPRTGGPFPGAPESPRTAGAAQAAARDAGAGTPGGAHATGGHGGPGEHRSHRGPGGPAEPDASDRPGASDRSGGFDGPGDFGPSGDFGEVGAFDQAGGGFGRSGAFPLGRPATGSPTPGTARAHPSLPTDFPHPTGRTSHAGTPSPPGFDPRQGFQQDTGPTATAGHDHPGPGPRPDEPATPSDTGSFHLPPPQGTPPSAWHAATPPQAATPATGVPLAPAPHGGPHDFPPAPRPPRPRLPLADASTASYTTEEPRAHVPARAASRHRAVRARRPGPPAKAVVPLLLLALACYAAGFWALSRL